MKIKLTEADKTQDIKIRYAYIPSPANLRRDPIYYETPRYKVLTIEELETRSIKTTLEELITEDKEARIKIIARDRCTELKDMNGTEIFEHDIIRWYPNRPKNHIDVLVEYGCNRFVLGGWYEDDYPDTEEYCKVIGTEYGMV
jgi:hypothetical protein